MSTSLWLLGAVGLVGLLVGPSHALGAIEDLERRFTAPPDEARIMVRWWWFGPAVTREGIERELKIMKAGGIGGVEVQPTYPLILDGAAGDPANRNQKFMSPEFLDLIGFTAAKCAELGLRMDLTLGSGWPYGGPMFEADEGAGRLETAVVAAPAGTNRVAVPELRPAHTAFAAFAGPAGATPSGDLSAFKEVPIEGGHALLPDGFAGGEVVFFISGRTRMQVKRPATGAEGPVIDHLSQTVVEKFIREVAEPELKACGDHPPYSFFCDSLEVGGENWTDDFLEEFQKRRGYDLRPYLPALLGNVGAATAGIRHDYAQTITELFVDRFNKPLQALAAKYRTRYRIQGYGSPPFALSSYASTDLAEGEAGGNGEWRTFRTTRFASSANHLLGRPVTSSETFTWLHRAPFRATPVDIKGEVDTHFLDGVNQIICHGWPYTPAGVGYPGTSFYAAAVFHEQNPWYVAMPEICAYMQRVSQMMREGTPANDVALYLPNADIWTRADVKYSSMNAAFAEQGPIVSALVSAGYNLDGWDDGILAGHGKVERGALVFGDLRYEVVVLPNVTHLPLRTARSMKEFVEGGGILLAVGNVPSVVPGLKATPDEQRELAEIMTGLFAAGTGKATLVADAKDLPAALAKRRKPDVALDVQDGTIGSVHRHTADAEIYFMANTSNQPRRAQATFRVQGLRPELWDPLTGTVRPLRIAAEKDGTTTVELHFEPLGSLLVVWTRRDLGAALPSAGSPKATHLGNGWDVTFGQGWKKVRLDEAASWTAVEGMKNFSGVATYERTFTATAGMTAKGSQVAIDFGEVTALPSTGGGRRENGYVARVQAPVRDAAVVFVNGRRAGAAWCPPYRVSLDGFLREGENTLRIEVGNTAVNRLALDGFPNYDLEALRRVYGNRFDPQNSGLLTEPLPSGLLAMPRLLWHEP